MNFVGPTSNPCYLFPFPPVMCDFLHAAISEAIRECGPREAYARLVKANDALILSPDLDIGRRIVTERTAIHAALVAHWAEAEHREFGYDRPFAVAALGGTGRWEMTPCSDTDLALLFDDAIEGNAFRIRLQSQTLHTGEFEERYGFRVGFQPFQLEDMARLAGKQLNAFIDLEPVYDPDGLTARFRERIRATFDPFEHFLEVSRFGRDRTKAVPGPDHERLDRFDIKVEGLRTFLSGIWTLAIEDFRPSREVYRDLEDPRDLEAYEFLLRMRAFIHLRRGTRKPERPDGTHPEDQLEFADFLSFEELLHGNPSPQEIREFNRDVRQRLLGARRRVITFARGVIGRELQNGRGRRAGHPVVVGPGGLRHTGVHAGLTARERSSAALGLLLMSQRYGVPINPAELEGAFDGAGDWLEPVPELTALFYETRGSLAESLEFLSKVEGAEERLFPGYDRFASSVEARVLAEREWCRGALARRKLETLRKHVEEGNARIAASASPDRLIEEEQGLNPVLEAGLLDEDHLAAVKLALQTKRLPVTEEDLQAREDASLPDEERYESGFSRIPLRDYFRPLEEKAEFPEEAVRTAEFLVANRRAFKQLANNGFNDAAKVERFARLCGGNLQRLRALFVFTCADRAEWENAVAHPSRWFNIRELYLKSVRGFGAGPVALPASALRADGYGKEETAVLEDFGEDFFSGMYRKQARRFGAHLVAMARNEGPAAKAAIVRDGTVTILGVAAADFPGLAACITGALWHRKISLTQANLFSAMNQGLALDFFHLAPANLPPPEDLTRCVEAAVQGRFHIGPEDEALLVPLDGQWILEQTRPGQYRLRHETPRDVPGLVYALCYKVFRHLGANIHGLKSQVAHGRSFISIYLSLAKGMGEERARIILGRELS